MFRFTQANATRAALLAATVALFASHTAMAAQHKEVSYWADAQTASQAGDRKDGAQLASQAGDRKNGAQLASRATGNGQNAA